MSLCVDKILIMDIYCREDPIATSTFSQATWIWRGFVQFVERRGSPKWLWKYIHILKDKSILFSPNPNEFEYILPFTRKSHCGDIEGFHVEL